MGIQVAMQNTRILFQIPYNGDVVGLHNTFASVPVEIPIIETAMNNQHWSLLQSISRH